MDVLLYDRDLRHERVNSYFLVTEYNLHIPQKYNNTYYILFYVILYFIFYFILHLILYFYAYTECKMVSYSSLLNSGIYEYHCVKSVRVRGFSSPYFPVFGLNAKRFGVSLRIQSKYGKIRTKQTPNTDTFHVVYATGVMEILFLFHQLVLS